MLAFGNLCRRKLRRPLNTSGLPKRSCQTLICLPIFPVQAPESDGAKHIHPERAFDITEKQIRLSDVELDPGLHLQNPTVTVAPQ
jgi:hypothetical protein